MLTTEIEFDIRFSETDAMGVVWHGNYLKYFEDGREAFGKEFGMEYLDIYSEVQETYPKVETDYMKIEIIREEDGWAEIATQWNDLLDISVSKVPFLRTGVSTLLRWLVHLIIC